MQLRLGLDPAEDLRIIERNTLIHNMNQLSTRTAATLQISTSSSTAFEEASSEDEYVVSSLTSLVRSDESIENIQSLRT